jgi:hypothetical protein
MSAAIHAATHIRRHLGVDRPTIYARVANQVFPSVEAVASASLRPVTVRRARRGCPSFWRKACLQRRPPKWRDFGPAAPLGLRNVLEQSPKKSGTNSIFFPANPFAGCRLRGRNSDGGRHGSTGYHWKLAALEGPGNATGRAAHAFFPAGPVLHPPANTRPAVSDAGVSPAVTERGAAHAA